MYIFFLYNITMSDKQELIEQLNNLSAEDLAEVVGGMNRTITVEGDTATETQPVENEQEPSEDDLKSKIAELEKEIAKLEKEETTPPQPTKIIIKQDKPSTPEPKEAPKVNFGQLLD